MKRLFKSSQGKDDYEPPKPSIPSGTRQVGARVGTACNTEHLVLLAGILHDCPNGIPVQELSKIAKLGIDEICRIVDQSPVLKRSPMGGRECICLSQNLKSRLNTMKESQAYKEFIATQRSVSSPSTASLAKLSTVKDSLDSDILDVVDKQFQLDGRLTDILSTCFELFLGQTARGEPSATDTFLLLLGPILSRPETLEGDLVELMERELHIPGKLKPTLNAIHKKIYGPKYSGQSLGCDRFLQIIEEPFEMKAVVRDELKLSDVELEDGLTRVCRAIKSRKIMDV